MSPAAKLKGRGKQQSRKRVALLAGIGLALVAYVLMRRRDGGSGVDGIPLLPAQPPLGESAIDPGGSAQAQPDVGAIIDAILAAQPPAVAPASEVFETAGGTVIVPPGGTPIVVSAPTPAAAEDGPAGQLPPPPNAAVVERATGFWWNIRGRQTWVTRANVSVFLAELRRVGADLGLWVERHPTAAATVGINKPPPRPVPRGGGKVRQQASQSLGSRVLAVVSGSQSSAPAAAPVTRAPSVAPVYAPAHAPVYAPAAAAAASYAPAAAPRAPMPGPPVPLGDVRRERLMREGLLW